MKGRILMAKVAAIVFAGTGSPEALGRVVNALTTAKEFHEAGDGAVVIFDGAGTTWIGELSQTDHAYHGLYAEVKGLVSGACSYCAEAFGVREQVEQANVALLDEYSGHPSIRALVADEYTVLTF